MVGGDASQGEEQLQEQEEGSSSHSVRQSRKVLEVIENLVWNRALFSSMPCNPHCTAVT